MVLPAGSPLLNFTGPANVQASTIAMDQAIVARANAAAQFHYSRALADWQQNKAQCDAYNLRVPPPPTAPPTITLHVAYADPVGNLIEGPGADDGSHVAWVWETQQ